MFSSYDVGHQNTSAAAPDCYLNNFLDRWTVDWLKANFPATLNASFQP